MKTIAWTAAALLIATAPLAAQQHPAEPQPQQEDRVHVVRSGDTLWDIARSYLSDPFMWPEIFRLNTDVVRNPARIYPNHRLRLPGYTGQGHAPLATDALQPGRTVFFPRAESTFRGPAHTVRAAGTADVPVLAPGDFYRAGFLARDRDTRPVARVEERLGASVIAMDLPEMIQQYDRVYLSLAAADALRPGDRVQLYRPGRAIRRYGRIFTPTGVATVAAVDGRVATAVVVQVYDAVTVGDFARPLPEFPVPVGVQPVADEGPRGEIVAFQRPNALHMPQDVAFLNLGEQAGVREGDEFAVYRPAERRAWGRTTALEVARLQVVRVEPGSSAARVIGLDHPALEPGLVVQRVARMP